VLFQIVWFKVHRGPGRSGIFEGRPMDTRFLEQYGNVVAYRVQKIALTGDQRGVHGFSQRITAMITNFTGGDGAVDRAQCCRVERLQRTPGYRAAENFEQSAAQLC